MCALKPKPEAGPTDTAVLALDAARVVLLQEEATAHWHNPLSKDPRDLSAFDGLVLEQHRANFDLWHQEDSARDPRANDHALAEIKRAIDRLNQRRNDLVEQLDLELLEKVGEQNAEATLHSETPGLMIDRLSILALKLFHTAVEAHRDDATSDHRERNEARWRVLKEQRTDLAACLQTLWTDTLAGRRRFKLYRQMKMYNDPALNPVLYKARATG